jgi:hypothetical protein
MGHGSGWVSLTDFLGRVSAVVCLRSLSIGALLSVAVLGPAQFDGPVGSVQAHAQNADPKSPQEKKDLEALNSLADELIKLSNLCASYKAYSEGRAECERGLRVFDSPKLQNEIKKLAGKKDGPPKTFAQRLEVERPKALEKCSLILADLAAACSKQGRTEAFERYVRAIQQDFPSEKALAKLDLAWFEPYRKWVSRDDAKKLEAGQERVDGKWLDPAALEASNRKHSTWDAPWVESDGVHELRTTVPLRTARRLLAYITAYRAFFLQEFGGGWDLKPPSGKLPVILTETQPALREQMKKRVGDATLPGGMQGAAYYMSSNMPLNPCFVTLEPTDATGRTLKVGIDDVLRTLTHELTHQIAFEYSKHDCDSTRLTQHQFWAVEGLATFMQGHVFEKGVWRLRQPRLIPLGGNLFEQGSFTLCVEHLDRLPPLAKYMAQSQAELMTLENYSIAATLAYFLLRGEEGAYRASFLKLLERVHKVRDTEKTFAECFEGVDTRDLDAQFRRFAEKIKLE